MRKMIILTLIFLSCTVPLATFFINPEYNKVNYSDKQLGIYPISTEIMFLENVDDFRKQFMKKDDAENEVKMARDSFSHYFVDVAMNNEKKITIDTSLFEMELPDKREMIVSYPLGETGAFWDFKIPNLNRRERNGIQFMLILGKVEFSKKIKEHKTPLLNQEVAINRDENGNLSISNTRIWYTSNFKIMATFIVWDFDAGKPVCYGMVDEEYPIFISMNKENWINMFKRISTMVFIKTPFNFSY
jgi:hypothetical protein